MQYMHCHRKCKGDKIYHNFLPKKSQHKRIKESTDDDTYFKELSEHFMGEIFSMRWRYKARSYRWVQKRKDQRQVHISRFVVCFMFSTNHCFLSPHIEKYSVTCEEGDEHKIFAYCTLKPSEYKKGISTTNFEEYESY